MFVTFMASIFTMTSSLQRYLQQRDSSSDNNRPSLKLLRRPLVGDSPTMTAATSAPSLVGSVSSAAWSSSFSSLVSSPSPPPRSGRSSRAVGGSRGSRRGQGTTPPPPEPPVAAASSDRHDNCDAGGGPVGPSGLLLRGDRDEVNDERPVRETAAAEASSSRGGPAVGRRVRELLFGGHRKRDPVVIAAEERGLIITRLQKQQHQHQQNCRNTLPPAKIETGDVSTNGNCEQQDEHRRLPPGTGRFRADPERSTATKEGIRTMGREAASALGGITNINNSSNGAKEERERASLSHGDCETAGPLKKTQDCDIRQRRAITEALAAARPDRNSRTGGTKGGRARSSMLLWSTRGGGVRAATGGTRNSHKENRPPPSSSSPPSTRTSVTAALFGGDCETTSRDPSNASLCDDVSLSAVWSQDGDDSEPKEMVEEGRIVHGLSPLTATEDVACGAPRGGTAVPQHGPPAVPTPLFNLRKDEDDKSASGCYNSSTRPWEVLPQCSPPGGTPTTLHANAAPTTSHRMLLPTAVSARRLHLGAVRTMTMDGIVESFPERPGEVLATERGASFKRGSQLDFAKTRSQLSMKSLPASPEEAAYYTSNQTRGSALSPRDASTMLTWV